MAFQNGPLLDVFVNTKSFLFWRSSGDKLIINLKMQSTCSGLNYIMIWITLAMKSFATYRNWNATTIQISDKIERVGEVPFVRRDGAFWIKYTNCMAFQSKSAMAIV